MPLRAIEKLLKEAIGLHSATVGSGSIGLAVEQRMRDCGVEDPHSYHQLLSRSATELNTLIDRVVVPETWFYRDRNPFLAFSDWLINHWIPHPPAATLRILSAPCSTGEEPYTLAMCLADCGIETGSARIDAIDVSNTNLQTARQARYNFNSFRGDDLRFRDTYFETADGLFQLKDDIRGRVQFEQANILGKDFIVNRAPYHVIFCRNLLIYFDRPTQQRVIDRLEKLLHHDGLLFMGHSETSLLSARHFTALDFPRSFAFRRGHSGEQTSGTDRRRPPRRVAAGPPQGAADKRFTQRSPLASGNIGNPADAVDQAESDLLQQAFELADQGRLGEAAKLCEALLDKQSLQSNAYHLLGLIREAGGDIGQAEQLFRRAIYLQPDHYEALTQLSVICGRKGDTQNAHRFKQRAVRARKRSQAQETAE